VVKERVAKRKEATRKVTRVENFELRTLPEFRMT